MLCISYLSTFNYPKSGDFTRFMRGLLRGILFSSNPGHQGSGSSLGVGSYIKLNGAN